MCNSHIVTSKCICSDHLLHPYPNKEFKLGSTISATCVSLGRLWLRVTNALAYCKGKGDINCCDKKT